MDNQRPQEPGSREGRSRDGTPEYLDQGLTPDAQPTQPIAVRRSASATGNRGGGRQRWILGGVLAFVLVAALVALLLFMDDDDDDEDDTTGDAQATEEVATETTEASLDPTATATTEEPTSTPEPEPTATDGPATETPEPDEEATEEAATETAEATAEPTATEPEPTDTPDDTDPEATETPDDAEPTPTEPGPEPTPTDGQLAYEADWSNDDDSWELTAGWVIEDGELVSSNNSAPIVAGFTPQQPDYAIEAEIEIANLTGCSGRAGVFARVTEASNQGANTLVGYAGTVCADNWQIAAILAADRDTLESDDWQLESGVHLYRLEVSGEQIRLFIDGAFVGDATDDRWDEAGGVGIYVEGDVSLTVRAFRVFDLDNGG